MGGNYYNKVFKVSDKDIVKVYNVYENLYAADRWTPVEGRVSDSPYAFIDTIEGKWYGQKGTDFGSRDEEKIKDEIEELKKFILEKFGGSYTVKFIDEGPSVEVMFRVTRKK